MSGLILLFFAAIMMAGGNETFFWIFGIIGLLSVICSLSGRSGSSSSSSREKPRTRVRIPGYEMLPDTFRCSICGCGIWEDTMTCPHCGVRFTRTVTNEDASIDGMNDR